MSLVFIKNPDLPDHPPATTTREAFEEVWQDKGFVLVDDKGDPLPDPAELKGKALDDALTAAGLPVTGTADEKRAALAAHTGQEA